MRLSIFTPSFNTEWIADTLLRPRVRYGDIVGEPGRATGAFDIPQSMQIKLEQVTGTWFTSLVYQAYRDGDAWCDWHYDYCDSQALLSLGAARRFGYRKGYEGEPTFVTVRDGDLVYMPPGAQDVWQHCLPPQADVVDERLVLVFRN